MLNDKWKQHPLSVARLTLVIFYYYFIFLGYIPNFVYKLQVRAGIYTDGIILIQYQVLAYLIGLIPILLLMLPLLKTEVKIELKKLIITFISLMIIALLLNTIFTIFISWINNGVFITSSNQAGLNELMEQNIYLHHFMVVVLAPCLEELVFRGVIFRKLRSDYSFWTSSLISSLLFGFIHVSSSFILGNWLDFTYLLLYAGLGFLFSCTYEYNHTIYACIIMHMLYNGWTVFM